MPWGWFYLILRSARRRAGPAGRDDGGRAKRQARIAVMTDKIKGSPSQHKPFRVRRDANGSDILASFDTLEDAVRNVRRRRSDWRDVIHDGRKIVWPRAEPRLSRLLPGERGGYNEFAIPCL